MVFLSKQSCSAEEDRKVNAANILLCIINFVLCLQLFHSFDTIKADPEKCSFCDFVRSSFEVRANVLLSTTENLMDFSDPLVCQW